MIKSFPGRIIEIDDEMAQAIMLSYLTLEMHEDLERKKMREEQAKMIDGWDD